MHPYWRPVTRFQARLRLPPTRLLRKYEFLFHIIFRTSLANPFQPDLWGYVHVFGYHDVQ